MSIGHTQMSIRPLDEQKCPLDIHMSIRPMDEQKCPFDIQMSTIRPFVHWANRNVQWTFKCPLDILQRYWTCMSTSDEHGIIGYPRRKMDSRRHNHLRSHRTRAQRASCRLSPLIARIQRHP